MGQQLPRLGQLQILSPLYQLYHSRCSLVRIDRCLDLGSLDLCKSYVFIPSPLLCASANLLQSIASVQSGLELSADPERSPDDCDGIFLNLALVFGVFGHHDD